MSGEPLVSVIIIFLNGETFIEEAIQSVFDQTYENWELFLVDDGSTDNSTRIALRYAEQCPRKVHYLEHPEHQNRGMSATRNLGLSQAKGEYIAFLDADDVWLPNKLEQQVAILRAHPEANVIYGRTLYWHSWTGKPEDVQEDVVADLGVEFDTLFTPPTLLALSFPLGGYNPPSSSNLLMRRGVIERSGGYEETFRGVCEDFAFLAKVYLKENVFVASESDYWDKYRQHPGSCFAVTERTGQYLTERLLFLDWLVGYLSEQGAEHSEIWRLLLEEKGIMQVRANVHERKWKEAMRGLIVLLWYHPRALVQRYHRLRSRLKLRRKLPI
jgi:glycosyltransferase involved in cell wall biosynthesis